jgi:hypothetical protein
LVTGRAAPEVGREIAVMTPADQERVRQAGKAIAAGQKADTVIWPGYVDRDDLAHGLDTYAMGLEDLRMDADYLAEGKLSPEERRDIGLKSASVQDETSALIDRLATARDLLLDDARTGKGLAAIERAQIAATVADIDSGRINGPGQLPQLLFADERTKASLDSSRTSDHASRFAQAAREALTQRLDAMDVVEPASTTEARLTTDIAAIGSSLRDVASASPTATLDELRREFLQRRGRLEQDLTQAGVQVAARAEIRGLVDVRGKEAGQLGRTAAERREQWHTRTAQAVTARDTAAARRAAVDAGEARPAERACATPPTRTAGQAASTGRGARIAQLHSQEVGR